MPVEQKCDLVGRGGQIIIFYSVKILDPLGFQSWPLSQLSGLSYPTSLVRLTAEPG